MSFFACDTGEKVTIIPIGSGSSLTAGKMTTCTIGGVRFNMASIPAGLTFPIGVDDSGNINGEGEDEVDPVATIADSYLIGETEVTYQLWSRVYIWATGDTDMDGVIEAGETAGEYSFGFTSESQPRAGSDGTPGSDTDSLEPVTYVNWRHAMVWCNALTEWYNANNGAGEELDCVYYEDKYYQTPLRQSSDDDPAGEVEDRPFVKSYRGENTSMAFCVAKGFRLLTGNEWECASRYKDGTAWTPGDHASGAAADWMNDAETFAVGVFVEYFNGSSTGVSSTADVKTKRPNALGLYDMSGNVGEWCYDWYPESTSERVIRGGSFTDMTYMLQLGYVRRGEPNSEYMVVGFRFARSR